MKKSLKIHLIPQSHIDIVWLWRYDPETIHRCCKPTFTRAVENLERFPQYTFNQSQAPLYEPVKRVYPSLHERIERSIAEGRWEIVGGMYVEPEGGEPSGEALVRQCVMGKRYFEREYGVTVTTGWQPDAWSHPAQLPQILRKSGIDSYVFFRGDVGENLFWWQAPDGSKVLGVYRFSHPDSYDLRNPGSFPFSKWKENARTIDRRYDISDTMVVVGGGDHGGGLDAEEIGAILEFAGDSGEEFMAEFSTVSRYVKTILDRNPELPTVDNELGLQLHGDLTNVGEIKKSNRECENLLVASEKWASIATALCGSEYPREELEEAWKKLLFNQFHDILGGSLIPPAIEDAMSLYRSIRESCFFVTENALRTLAGMVDTGGEGIPIVVFNSLSWDRTDVVEVCIEIQGEPECITLLDDAGKPVTVQVLNGDEDSGYRLLFVAEDVPSFGYKTFRARTSYPTPTPETASAVAASEKAIENEFFRVEIDPATGCLGRVLDKRTDSEVLDCSKRGNLLVAIEDHGDSEGRFVKDCDTIGKPPGPETEIVADPLIRVLEKGPVRGTIRVERRFQNSKFIQDIRLLAGVPRIDFEMEIDWHDVHTMIKVAFPLAQRSPEVTYDAPYGTIIRPADGTEYPAQKWVDLSENGSGASLLNNARYAHDVRESTVRMSLLRSPTEPAWNTDEGVHTLGYALYPHEGSWKDAGVMRQGHEFNHPLVPVFTKPHEGRLPADPSFFRVEPENVILEVLKQAYNSDRIVMRFYETHGQACTVHVALPFDIRAAKKTNLLETEEGDVSVVGKAIQFPMGASEIRTVLVEAIMS